MADQADLAAWYCSNALLCVGGDPLPSCLSRVSISLATETRTLCREGLFASGISRISFHFWGVMLPMLLLLSLGCCVDKGAHGISATLSAREMNCSFVRSKMEGCLPYWDSIIISKNLVNSGSFEYHHAWTTLILLVGW